MVGFVDGPKNLQPGSKGIPPTVLHRGFLFDSVGFQGVDTAPALTRENRVDASIALFPLPPSHFVINPVSAVPTAFPISE